MEPPSHSTAAITAEYRAHPVVLVTLMFLLSSAWLYFAPVTGGVMGRVLRTNDGFTLLGMLAFSTSVVLGILGLIYTGRILLGLPALKRDDRLLYTYVFPFKSLSLAEIERVVVHGNDVEILTKQHQRRRVNVRLVRDHERFFENLMAQIDQRRR